MLPIGPNHETHLAGSRQSVSNPRRASWLEITLLGGGIVLLVVLWLVLELKIPDDTRLAWELLFVFSIVGLSLLLGLRVFWVEKGMLSLREDWIAAQDQANQVSQRLEVLFQISQKYVESVDENEIVDYVLSQALHLSGAAGVSFVPLDERGQPLAAIRQGTNPVPVSDAWLEYLASPSVRDRCKACRKYESTEVACPLLHGSFIESKGVYCLPLQRGNKEYGVMNLYFPEPGLIDPETRNFLRAVADETALAIESLRLRQREMDTLRQMQLIRQKTDLSSLFVGQMESLREALEADFVLLLISSRPGDRSQPTLDATTDPIKQIGTIPSECLPALETILYRMLDSKKPFFIADTRKNTEAALSPEGLEACHSLMAVPLAFGPENPSGSLLVGKIGGRAFHSRQLILLEVVSGQIALLLQNAHEVAGLRVKTILEERNRLSREIHDGLAQTIGFLKLQMAQMQGYLDRNDQERLRQSMQLVYNAITDAYQEARFAIDGLRVTTEQDQLSHWIRQTVEEFRQNLGGDTSVFLEVDENSMEIPSEVQVQLIRILQEALSNVRKHSQACNVWVNFHETQRDILLSVRDDGAGFSPEDVSSPARHGLQGMRERSELIGADFQIISQPGQGTTIIIRLPVLHAEVAK